MATLTDVSCMLFNFMKLVGISAKAMDLCNTFEPGTVSSLPEGVSSVAAMRGFGEVITNFESNQETSSAAAEKRALSASLQAALVDQTRSQRKGLLDEEA